VYLVRGEWKGARFGSSEWGKTCEPVVHVRGGSGEVRVLQDVDKVSVGNGDDNDERRTTSIICSRVRPLAMSQQWSGFGYFRQRVADAITLSSSDLLSGVSAGVARVRSSNLQTPARIIVVVE
jgi:hypothetical protein